MIREKLISIHLNTNKPEAFSKFITSLTESANEIEQIEVLVSIDIDDKNIHHTIKLLKDKYPNLIKIIKTDLIKSFSDAWKPLNILLNETSNSVKFISCMSDEIIFSTKGWDSIILNYDNLYEDNIFRIRCSRYKKEKYQDIWECGYKPDSYAFYTKKWLDLVGQWNPCIGPDTYQECISFYMNNYGEKFQRNIINDDIYLLGEEVSTGLGFKERIQRSRIYYKAFFKLMSYKIQKSASKSAFEIISEINGLNNLPNYVPLNRNKILWTNFIRRFNFFYYRGSPDHIINTKIKNLVFMIWCYLDFLDNYIVLIINFLYKKKYLKKIIRNEKNFKQVENIINNEKLS